MDECGRDGWELVALAAVADCLPVSDLPRRTPTKRFRLYLPVTGVVDLFLVVFPITIEIPGQSI